MNELKPNIHDETNGLDYVLAGDYYIPAIELPEDDDRPIGKWGRMHRAYLEETNPLLLNHLILTGRLHTQLTDLDEQARERCRVLIQLMVAAEGVTEECRAANCGGGKRQNKKRGKRKRKRQEQKGGRIGARKGQNAGKEKKDEWRCKIRIDLSKKV